MGVFFGEQSEIGIHNSEFRIQNSEFGIWNLNFRNNKVQTMSGLFYFEFRIDYYKL
jgi:hypothetical protein